MAVAIHRFAAVAGRVTTDAGGKSVPVPGAHVSIGTAPPRFQARLEARAQRFGKRWPAMLERPDRTVSGSDGHFHFMDLPNGDYEIRVAAPGAEQEVAVRVHVARDADAVKPPEKADVVVRLKQGPAPAASQPRPPRPRLGRRRSEEQQ